jgi:hypothetical protein
MWTTGQKLSSGVATVASANEAGVSSSTGLFFGVGEVGACEKAEALGGGVMVNGVTNGNLMSGNVVNGDCGNVEEGKLGLSNELAPHQGSTLL